MNLQVKVRYYAEVCVKPKIKAERMVFDSVVHVAIPEATSNEAPVAMRYKGWSHDKKKVELRFYDGRLWAPRAFHAGRDKPDVHQKASALVTACEEGDESYGLSNGLHDRVYGDSKGDIATLPNVRRVESSDLEENEAAIRANARDMLIVEGNVWEVVEEPAFTIAWPAMFSRDREVFIHVEANPSSKQASNHFRFDETESLFAKIGGKSKAKLPFHEVVIPEALTQRLAERALVEWGKSLVSTIGDKVKEEGREYFDAFATLRDAIPAADAALVGPAGEGRDEMDALADAGAVAARLEHERYAKDPYATARDFKTGTIDRYRASVDTDHVAMLAM